MRPASAGSPASQTTTPATAPAVSAADLQHLVDTLDDPAARQVLVTQLQALIATEKNTAPPASEPPPAPSLVDTLADHVDTVTDEVLAATQVVIDAPQLLGWLQEQASNVRARDFWTAISLRLLLILGLGIVGDWTVRFALRRPRRMLAATQGTTAGARLALIGLGIAVEALPVLAFTVVAYFTVPFTLSVPFTTARYRTRHVASVFIGAILVARLILAAARGALLSPSAIALCPLGEETRQYLYIWVRRFTNWTVYGYAVTEGGYWLHLPPAIYSLALRVTILVLAVLAVVFVLQNRRTVADWLRGDASGTAGWRQVRQRLADTWHVLVVIYIIGTFGVFVLNVTGGFLFLLRATVVTVLMPLAAALIVRAVERLARRGFAVSPDLKQRYPTLETRANRYLPVLHWVTAVIVYAFAALVLLETWGLNAFAWLETDPGRRLTASFVTIAVVVIGALIAWELLGSAIERYLNATDGAGARLARSARARTLLPLLRTTVLVTLVVLAGLTVMAAVGVNIAPLLAGAGVVGLAVGFGSQALVKDVITGLFILIEDTMAVGDVVDVGKGSGVVEALTIRTIKLRDMSGTLQTIPFSEVTTIKNMARDYAYAVLDVGVLYREDPERVIAALRAIAVEMAGDRDWRWRMLAPLEVIGLDRFTDSAQVIRIRLKTAPLEQWPVQREFNLRMKKAFDHAGIEMPSANQTHYLAPPPAA